MWKFIARLWRQIKPVAKAELKQLEKAAVAEGKALVSKGGDLAEQGVIQAGQALQSKLTFRTTVTPQPAPPAGKTSGT